MTEKTAIVTGAARGIGLATARLFLAEGGRVAMIDRDEAALREAAALKIETWRSEQANYRALKV